MARRDAALVMGASAAAAALVWGLSAPALLVHINWDAGGYLHEIASGKLDWSSKPWNVHYLLHYLYLLGVWTAAPFGGTPADGFRLVQAASAGVTFGLLLDACRRLSGSWWVAALGAASWLTAFVTIFLVLTLEDNLIYLAPAAAVVWLLATRHAVWSWREALASGACAAVATLISAQGVLHLFPALLVTLVLRPRAVRWPRRLAEAALVLVGLLGATALIILALAATSQLGARALAEILLAGPNETEFPQTGAEILTLATDTSGALRVLGIGFSYQLFANRLPFAAPHELKTIGRLLLGALVCVWVATGVLVHRRERWAPHVLASTLLLLTLLTAPYRDVEYAYLKRLDFLPLLLAPLAAALLAALPARRWRHAGTAALAALVIAQAALAATWRHHEVRGYPTLDKTVVGRPVPGYHGTPEGPFLHHFRRIRERFPDACEYIFDITEVAPGQWNHDVTGSLWSELPDHAVIGEEAARWLRPPRAIAPTDPRATRACAWRSPAARARTMP
jgi:hypothetical protein